MEKLGAGGGGGGQPTVEETLVPPSNSIWAGALSTTTGTSSPAPGSPHPPLLGTSCVLGSRGTKANVAGLLGQRSQLERGGVIKHSLPTCQQGGKARVDSGCFSRQT